MIAVTCLFFILLALCDASQYLLLGPSNQKEFNLFISTMVYSSTKDKPAHIYSTLNNLVIAEVPQENRISPHPVKLISLHQVESINHGIIALLKHIKFGFIDGIISTVENDDEVDTPFLMKNFFCTAKDTRLPFNKPLRMVRNEEANLAYYNMPKVYIFPDGESLLITKAVQNLARVMPKLRVMDFFNIYGSAALCTQPNNRGAWSHALHEYGPCLFNALIAENFPLELLMLALELKEYSVIQYLTGDLPKEHMEVLLRMFDSLDNAIAHIEREQLELPKFEYPRKARSFMFREYHRSFASIMGYKKDLHEKKVEVASKICQLEAKISESNVEEGSCRNKIESNEFVDYESFEKLKELHSTINSCQQEIDRLELELETHTKKTESRISKRFKL